MGGEEHLAARDQTLIPPVVTKARAPDQKARTPQSRSAPVLGNIRRARPIPKTVPRTRHVRSSATRPGCPETTTWPIGEGGVEARIVSVMRSAAIRPDTKV